MDGRVREMNCWCPLLTVFIPGSLRAVEAFRVGRGLRNMYALESCPAVATEDMVGVLAKPACGAPFAVFFFA